MKKLNLLNQKFGRLTVISQEQSKCGKTIWKCLCDCGNLTNVTSTNLTCGRINSCGCIRKEQITKRNITHNQRHTYLYEVWKGMKQRCYNSKSKAFKNYGARGITVCEKWKNDFQSFYDWSYANGYTPDNQKDEKTKLTIDRIDVNRNYEPSNCRWVDRKTQASNKRTTKLITINEETKCLNEWFRVLKVNAWDYYKRIKNGMTPEQALTK